MAKLINISIGCIILCLVISYINSNKDNKYYLLDNKKVAIKTTANKIQSVPAADPVKEKQKDFFSKYVGHCINFDDFYGCQCVDIINLYIVEVFDSYPIMVNTDAYNMGLDPSLIIPKELAYIHLEANNNYEYGDILFWTGEAPGHVAIYIGDNKIIGQNNANSFWNGSPAEVTNIFAGVTKIVRIKK